MGSYILNLEKCTVNGFTVSCSTLLFLNSSGKNNPYQGEHDLLLNSCPSIHVFINLTRISCKKIITKNSPRIILIHLISSIMQIHIKEMVYSSINSALIMCVFNAS